MASSGQLSTRSPLLSWGSASPRSTVAVAVRSLLSCCAAPWSPPWPLSRAKAGPARPRTRQGSMAVRSLRTGLLHPWGVLPTFRPGGAGRARRCRALRLRPDGYRHVTAEAIVLGWDAVELTGERDRRANRAGYTLIYPTLL